MDPKPGTHWQSVQPGGLDSAQKMGMSLSRSHSHLQGNPSAAAGWRMNRLGRHASGRGSPLGTLCNVRGHGRLMQRSHGRCRHAMMRHAVRSGAAGYM